MARKRISRKELLKEPDKIFTISSRMFAFILDHQTHFVSGLCVFFAIVSLILGIRYFNEQAEIESFSLMQQAVSKYEDLKQKDGPEKAYKDVREDFQQLLEKHTGKVGAKLARLVSANISYEGGETDMSIELYKRALSDFDKELAFYNQILSSLGYCHERKKDFKSAADYFERLAAGADPAIKDEALFNLGRIYSLMGDSERSEDAYRKILADHADSIYIDLIKDKVSG